MASLEDQPESHYDSPLHYAVTGLLVAALLIGMFWGIIFRGESVAFRDAGHYYFPLYQIVQNGWSSGLPIWNDLEQLGRPLMADPTAAVFYPGKIIFALPIEFGVAYNLFILGHVALSAFTSFLAARTFGCSIIASGLCGIAYAFGGPIVFQYCNAVFLISASWFPLAIAWSFRLAQKPNWRTLIGLSCVYAMIILGGDVQAIYHALLAQLILMWSTRAACSWRMRLRTLTFSAFAVLISVCWTAGQFLPSMEWAASSNRAATSSPRNIYELGFHFAASDEDRSGDAFSEFWTKPESGSHRDKTYQFSIGPWRWPELIWPNFSGRQLPENRRWLNSIPAERRVWAPTLYAGILVLLFALYVKARRDEVKWLRMLVAFSVLSSLGAYGLGWLVNEVMFHLGYRPQLWGPLGGLHWLMNVALPFFNLFRYPAKIWTMFSLASSLLAAIGFDQAIHESKFPRKAARILLGLSLGAFIVSFLFKRQLFDLWEDAPVDTLLGPLDPQGAFEDLTQSLLHCIFILAGFFILCRICDGKKKCFRIGIVLLTTVDIFVANRWTILSADADAWKQNAPIADAIRNHAESTHQQSMRTLRAGGSSWYPHHWSQEGDHRRIQQCVNWDRQTLKPKYGMLDEIQIVNGKGSFSDARVDHLLLRPHGDIPTDNTLDELGIRYVVAPSEHLESRKDLEVVFRHQVEKQDIGVGYNEDAAPDAWIADDKNEFYKPQQPNGECRVVRTSATEVVVFAKLDSPGIVVLNDLVASGWKCEREDLTSNAAPVQCEILPIRNLFRGVRVDSAGEYRIVFRYAPSVVYLGIAVSLVSITTTILFFAVVSWRSIHLRFPKLQIENNS